MPLSQKPIRSVKATPIFSRDGGRARWEWGPLWSSVCEETSKRFSPKRTTTRVPTTPILPLPSLLIVSCLLLAILVGGLTLQFQHNTTAHATAEHVLPGATTLPGTLSPLLAHSHFVGATDPQQHISLSIGLHPNNQTNLTRYAQDISRLGSINYHRFLTPAQYTGVFSPSQANYHKLQSYLTSMGFTITKTYNHRLLLSFSGTIAQVEQAFHVTIKNYVAADGRTYYANDTNPVFPAWLTSQIESISGLNNAVQWHHPLQKHTSSNSTIHSNSIGGCPTRGAGYLLPAQIASAYNLNGLYGANYQGGGQTIALFELSTFTMNDLVAYSSCFGHNHATIQTILTGGDPVTGGGDEIEVELDAQLILSAAPQLGRLRIYEAANTTADYLAEWAQIVQDATPVVSTSWGACEQLLGADTINQENTLFTSAAVQGQTLFAASGDSGSEGCESQDSSQTGLNAEDPGTQPYVTSVGGSTLTLATNDAYGSEHVWNTPADPTAGTSGGASGGGISQYWTAPGWQNAPGVNTSYSSGTTCSATGTSICRETPDISLDADPNTGYPIYCSVTAAGCSQQGAWYIFAGTSAAAPLWAAMMAMTNQMSLQQGGFNLGFLNPLLYQIANDPTMYADSFHDITAGNNDLNNQNSGSYPATAGYDMATGLGSYNAAHLAEHLVTIAQQMQKQRMSPANTTWYFAEGSVGGGFQEYLTLQNPSTIQDAQVNVSYLFQSKAPITVQHTVSRSSRATISANADLGIPVSAPQQAISAVVEVLNESPGIVVERPMYFHYRAVQSGTDVLGATSPGTSYYFPNVDTRQNGRAYYTYITMLNPSHTQNVTATVTYYTGSCGQAGQGACPTQRIVIPPMHRGTATPLALSLYRQMAASVLSDQPLVVERPMYFRDAIATAGGFTTGAASVVGATTPGIDWLFAEGYTGTNFQENLLLANFGASPTTATITLQFSNGHTQAVSVTVPALSQYNIDVRQVKSSLAGTCDTSPCSPTSEASIEVKSTAPIVAERLMYFHYGAGKYSGATETVGEAGPASHYLYAFAEGYTANSFNEYLTLQNTTASAEMAVITLFADTYVFQQTVNIKAHSRYTVFINPLVVPIAQSYNNLGSNSYSVSLTVQALGTNALLVAERPMYFNYYGDQGGTDIIGFTG